MGKGKNVYHMGLTAWDLVSYFLKMSLISISILLLLVLFFGILASLVSGYFLVGLISTMFIFAIFSVAGIPTALIMVLVSYLKYQTFRNCCRNDVKMGNRSVFINSQWSLILPVYKNKVAISNIDRMEELDERFYRERREKSPVWIKLGPAHMIPLGGFYTPLTSPQNLIALHLKEPVLVTNVDPRNPFSRGMLSRSGYVNEVIVDIEGDKHLEFISYLRERMKKLRYRKLKRYYLS